jgi:hypothetical protein
MEMNAQLIIVIVLLALAVFYISRTIYKSARGNACEMGSCKCEGKAVNKKVASH